MHVPWYRVALASTVTVCAGFLALQEALADWQYTRWGMSKAQVVEASEGLAVDHDVRKRETWGIYADLAAPFRFGKYSYRAFFYFDEDSGELTAVRLDPAADVWCPDVARTLMLRHGSNQQMLDGYFIWSDSSANSKISLSGFSTCRIKYEPLQK